MNSNEDSNFCKVRKFIFEKTDFNSELFESKKTVEVAEFISYLEDNEYEYWKLLRLCLNKDCGIFNCYKPKNKSAQSFLYSILKSINPNCLLEERSIVELNEFEQKIVQEEENLCSKIEKNETEFDVIIENKLEEKSIHEEIVVDEIEKLDNEIEIETDLKHNQDEIIKSQRTTSHELREESIHQQEIGNGKQHSQNEQKKQGFDNNDFSSVRKNSSQEQRNITEEKYEEIVHSKTPNGQDLKLLVEQKTKNPEIYSVKKETKSDYSVKERRDDRNGSGRNYYDNGFRNQTRDSSRDRH